MVHRSVVRCESNHRSVSSVKSDAPYGESLMGGPNENESVPGRADGNKSDKPDEYSRRRSRARHPLRPATFTRNEEPDPNSGKAKSDSDGLGEEPCGGRETDHDRPTQRH